MRLIIIAKRRLDGLIDATWVEGFEAFRLYCSPDVCPYPTDTEEFNSWIEGWIDAEDAAALVRTKNFSMSLYMDSWSSSSFRRGRPD